MADFPSSLPRPDIDYSFGNRATSTRIQRSSKSYSQVPLQTDISTIVASVQWTLSMSEYDTFVDWFVDDLESGTLPFNIELSFGDEMTSYECEFEEAKYSLSHTGNQYFTVSSTLICYDAGNIPTEEALDLMLELSEDIGILENASDRLHVLVNETIPEDDWGDV